MRPPLPLLELPWYLKMLEPDPTLPPDELLDRWFREELAIWQAQQAEPPQKKARG